MGKSVSFRTSNKMTSIGHNNRTEEDREKLQDKDNHVQWENTHKNVVLADDDIRDIYQEQFQKSIIGYNMKQKRKDRKISTEYGAYYKKIRDEKGKGNSEEQREFIVQFGAKGDEQFDLETSNAMFTEYLEEFKERNPDMKVYNAVIHNDEATPHMHFNIVPVGRGYKKGLAVQPSFTRALETSGVTFDEMMERERESLADIMEKHTGVERKLVGTHDYIPPSQYRGMMSEADEKMAKAELMLASADEKMVEVNEHVGKINEKYADIKAKEQGLDARAQGLDAREREMGKWEKDLQKGNKTLETSQKAFESHMETREDEILEELEKGLSEREQKITEDETSLGAGLELLEKNESDLADRRDKVIVKEHNVSEREKELNAKEKLVKSWEKVRDRFSSVLLKFTEEQQEEREKLAEIVEEHTPLENDNLSDFSEKLDELASDGEITLSDDDIADLKIDKQMKL